MATIGGNLKAQLKTHGMSASDLARALGWQPQRVNDLMNRHRSWEVPTLLKVATKLGISVEELLSGIDDEYDSRCDLARQAGTRPSASKHQSTTQEAPRNVVVEHGPATSALEDKIDQTRTQLEAIRDSLNTLVDDLADRRKPRKAKPHSAGAR